MLGVRRPTAHGQIKANHNPGLRTTAPLRQTALSPRAGGTSPTTNSSASRARSSRVDEIEMEIAALYAEIEELHRKVDAP